VKFYPVEILGTDAWRRAPPDEVGAHLATARSLAFGATPRWHDEPLALPPDARCRHSGGTRAAHRRAVLHVHVRVGVRSACAQNLRQGRGAGDADVRVELATAWTSSVGARHVDVHGQLAGGPVHACVSRRAIVLADVERERLDLTLGCRGAGAEPPQGRWAPERSKSSATRGRGGVGGPGPRDARGSTPSSERDWRGRVGTPDASARAACYAGAGSACSAAAHASIVRDERRSGHDRARRSLCRFRHCSPWRRR